MTTFTNNLIGYWTFDGVTTDSSGNGNTLALAGGATFGPGLFAQGLSLDPGTGSYAVATNNNTSDFQSGDFTVQIWANFNTTFNEATLIEKFSDGTGPGWTFTMPFQMTDLQFYATPNSGGPQLDTSVSIQTGVWEQFIIERNGTQLEMFWNGSLVATQEFSGTWPASSNPLLIGGRNQFNGTSFRVDGVIDDVAIWNRALSANEIASLWNGGTGQPVGSAVLLDSPTIISNGGGMLLPYQS
jgi:Concanavalin A-like lectin/glucanases superfamily